MLLGGAGLLGLMYAEDPGALAVCLDGLTGQQVAAAAWVSLLGGAAAYSLFFNAASKPGNLTQLSSLTFLTPVFAAAAGYLALGEVLTPQQLAGGSIVLLSVFFINSSRASKSSARK
jgi:drug/metabolite transporter (DMT)-like permease